MDSQRIDIKGPTKCKIVSKIEKNVRTAKMDAGSFLLLHSGVIMIRF